MNGYLLDTNVALFAAFELPLSARVRHALRQGPLILSAISYWEIVLKSMKGNLEVGDPRSWWREALERFGATALPLLPEHVSGIHDLPPLHADPFDRALIAQATAEELTLLSTDSQIRRYASSRLRVIS